jgi:hypothetical protein
MRIAGIATIIDDIFSDEIGKRITTLPKNPGSINLLQTLFQEKKVNYDVNALETLRDHTYFTK